MFCVNKEAKLSSGKKKKKRSEHQERAGVSEGLGPASGEVGAWRGGCELQAGEQELLIPQELREPPEHSRVLDRTSPQLWVSEQWCGKQMGGTY